MSVLEYAVGLEKEQIETPALMVDLDVMERNIERMASYFAGVEANLRPHAKIYKATPAFAHLQLQAGAIGITCAKLSEAEVLAAAGIKDILIANQVVGSNKIRRLVNLAAYTDIMVAVDNGANVAALSQAAQEKEVILRVLVEVNIGHNRCGVEPFQQALELSRKVLNAPGLKYQGMMGYDGHCTMGVSVAERGALSRKSNQLLADTRKYIESEGIEIEIVSAGGTFTYQYATQIEGITEIQAGTYIFMDTAFLEHGVTDFGCALSLLATVTSRPIYTGGESMAILDFGRKEMDYALGNPEVKEPTGAGVIKMSQEHTRLNVSKSSRALKVGDKVELWVRDANGTINLFDKMYGLRDGIVEVVWDIPGGRRGT
jgi:D-serine deaminase-like pyridoxal phosphate-dependent protein